MPENGDFHDPEPAQCRQPKPFGKMPVGAGKIFGAVPLAFFNDEHAVAFFRQSQGADRAAEAGADDDVVVVVVWAHLMGICSFMCD